MEIEVSEDGVRGADGVERARELVVGLPLTTTAAAASAARLFLYRHVDRE
jgi:hypothetical protein